MRIKLTVPLCLLLSAWPITPILQAEFPAEDAPTSSRLREADRYFDATLYDKAIPLYQDLLQPSTPSYNRLRLRLAQCYYLSDRSAKIPELFPASSNQESEPLDGETTLLLGAGYNRSQQPEKSILVLSNYLSRGNINTLPLYEEARYALGVAHFLTQQYPEARTIFQSFTEKSPEKPLHSHARVYLARIAIAEGRFLDAGRILHTIAKQENPDGTLRYSISFLQGEISFRQEDWTQAAAHFEETLPARNARKAEWHEDTLYYLGWCYMHLSHNPNLSSEEQAAYLSKAEATFLNSLELYPSEKGYLGLGQCYLAQSFDPEHPTARAKLDALLSKPDIVSSQEALQEALLLRAEAASSYQERKKFFRQITQESFAGGPYYAKAWYLCGLNEFDEAQSYLNANRTNEAKKHLNNAIEALGTAFDLLYPSDKKLAALALKYQAQAYSYQDTKEGYLKGLALVGKLLNRYRGELFPLLDSPDEIYYLQGVNASHLIEKDDGEAFFTLAVNSLSHTIDSYPNGQFYDESLHLLGSLYYIHGQYDKAKQTYSELAKCIPESPYMGDALFWTAYCLDNLGESPSHSKRYRRQVFEQFPHTAFADEAYFRYHTYQEYLKGDTETMEHLKALEAKFPESPFRINAYYLLGLDYQQERKSEDGRSTREKNPAAAIEAFQKAETTFDSMYCNGAIPGGRLEYFITLRYRAILERALTSMKLMESPLSEDAEKVLQRMYTDFENPDHSLTKILAAGESYSRLQEECAYYLTKCYIKIDNDKGATKVIRQMMDKYNAAKITRGYYLSRLWYQQGLLHAKHQKNDLALEDFARAEDAGRGKILSSDELLDLWIQESFCLRGQNRADEAMLLLSQVINYDAVSPHRLKAMYLRAKIYEEQGRYELARKQLEATAPKGGPWAAKAKAKLEKDYVYQ